MRQLQFGISCMTVRYSGLHLVLFPAGFACPCGDACTQQRTKGKGVCKALTVLYGFRGFSNSICMALDFAALSGIWGPGKKFSQTTVRLRDSTNFRCSWYGGC
jgi:hypothetical protein